MKPLSSRLSPVAPRSSDFADRLLVVIFLGTLVAFASVTLFGPGAGSLVSVSEKRSLAPAPAIPRDLVALEAFPGRFEAWFNDHLAGRAWLYQRYSLLKLKLWGQSSSPSVVVGRAGWLYYNARPFPEVGAGTMLDDYRGLVRLSEDRLAFMQFVLEVRRNWLAGRGVKYLFVVVPDKQSIYPEYLPARLVRRLRPETALDQFLTYLQAHSRFPVLDLRPTLLAAKESGAEPLLYTRTDTHWNVLGATLGQEAIVARLQEMLPQCSFPPPLHLDRSEETVPGGDLAGFLNLAQELPETRPVLWNPKPRLQELDWQLPGFDGWQRHSRWWRCEAPGARLRVVLFRDSCFVNMLQTFLERCAEVVAISRPDASHPSDFATKRRLLEEFRPNVVIDEVVERDLVRVLTNEGDPDLSDELARCIADR